MYLQTAVWRCERGWLLAGVGRDQTANGSHVWQLYAVVFCCKCLSVCGQSDLPKLTDCTYSPSVHSGRNKTKLNFRDLLFVEMGGSG
jgi:hypothetical protein